MPDPFASEIITEAISSYGVLLYRVAGAIAKERQDGMYVSPGYLDAAAARIDELAKRHGDAPATVGGSDQVVSSTGGDTGASDGERFFTDVTGASGVAFEHRTSEWLSRFRRDQSHDLPTFSGGGVAAEDVDGDGRIDLLFVGGGGVALYRNVGGRFEDVTGRAGIDWRRDDGEAGEARQPIIADFDNDGAQDILITYANDDHRLYRNLGELRFEDVSERAGLRGAGLIGGPATVFDYDGDGLLDIYIAFFGNYLRGDYVTQNRDNHNALPNLLYRNKGGMKFNQKPVTNGAGTPAGRRRCRTPTSTVTVSRTSSSRTTSAATRGCATWATDASSTWRRSWASTPPTTR